MGYSGEGANFFFPFSPQKSVFSRWCRKRFGLTIHVKKICTQGGKYLLFGFGNEQKKYRPF